MRAAGRNWSNFAHTHAAKLVVEIWPAQSQFDEILRVLVNI